MRKVIVEVRKNDKGGESYSYRYFGRDNSVNAQLEAIQHDIDEMTAQIKGLSYTTSVLTKERAKLKTLKELLEKEIAENKAKADENN